MPSRSTKSSVTLNPAGPADTFDRSQSRQSEPIDSENPPRLPFPVVGIGASAGGLEALLTFLKALPSESGIAYVFIQHLSPKHESNLAEILSKNTPLPVHQVEEGMTVQPNHLYVIRPGFTLTIQNGTLRLGESLLDPGHRRPVDDFFRSLAAEQRERSIAVILSGMGSNGTAGASMIKAVGGMCIAQDPETAKYPSMPRSLIESGLADSILRADEIPNAIIRFAAHPYVRGEFATTLKSDEETQHLAEVLNILRNRLRHDFTGYKKPTLLRRVERRMGLNQIEKMSEYARFVRQNPGEVTALSDDLMIHVTGFFRDAEAWDVLRTRVIETLVKEREENSTLRAWVTACSSGEEAYTLAMLLVEAAEAARKTFDIKIFATDTAERSLSLARAGIFPGGIESELSPQRLDRFFTKDDSFYRINKELRELVVFAPQNLLQDPPFSKLDICTCRNLLIYLEPEVQQRVMALLHFSLREGGTLFLGNSETVGAANESLFEPIDKKLRLYRRIGPTRHGTVEFPLPSGHATPADNLRPGTRPASRLPLPQLANRILLDEYTPAAVVVDREAHIVYYHGATQRYLDQPQGEPTRDALLLAKDSIRGTLRVALQRALTQNERVSLRDGTIGTPAGPRRIEICAAPLEKSSYSNYFIISFHEHTEAAEHPAGEDQSESHLRSELQRVRDELQSTIEELQTGNEEMKASAEETTSINEELQSTNEELETSKEELQSLNEELITVNGQLQSKMEELERTGNDLDSLLSSTNIAVVFLDTQFRIRRFTPAVRDLLDLILADVGRPLSDLNRKFEDPDLTADARTVLDNLVPIEREILSASNRWYVRRILPYRTSDNRIDGVVLTFVDITERRAALKARKELEERIIWSVQASGIGDWEYDFDARNFYPSPRTRELLGIPGDGPLPYDAFIQRVEPDDRQVFEQALARAADPRGDHRFNVEFRLGASGSHPLWLESRGAVNFREDSQGRVPDRLRGIVADASARKLDEMALREAKREAESANNAKDEFLATVSHELRTPLAAMLLWTRMLLKEKNVPPDQLEAYQSIIRSAETQHDLIEDLLDSARIAAGKLRIERTPVDLASIVRNIVNREQPLAKSRNIQIESTIARDIGIVRVDAGRLEQVVSNLLGNALKFTPTGGRIALSLKRLGDSVELRIADTGIGIHANVLPHVFDRLRQAEQSRNRSTGGLGLGLTIAKQIVELHHGTITAYSAGLEKGSTFVVTIPLPLASKSPATALLDPETPPLDLHKVNILVVEDDPAVGKALRLLLAGFGADVTLATSTANALEIFQKHRPNVLVSDIALPGEDGYHLMRRVRTFETAQGLPPTPAIAVTAFTQDSDRRDALASGFDYHVPKPIDAQNFLKILENIARAEQ